MLNSTIGYALVFKDNNKITDSLSKQPSVNFTFNIWQDKHQADKVLSLLSNKTFEIKKVAIRILDDE